MYNINYSCRIVVFLWGNWKIIWFWLFINFLESYNFVFYRFNIKELDLLEIIFFRYIYLLLWDIFLLDE